MNFSDLAVDLRKGIPVDLSKRLGSPIWKVFLVAGVERLY